MITAIDAKESICQYPSMIKNSKETRNKRHDKDYKNPAANIKLNGEKPFSGLMLY